MPRTLLWRLLAINLLVVGVAVGVSALTIGSLANAIFMNLMKEFHIQVDVMHRLFVGAMARSLLLVSLVAGGVGLLLSVVLFRRVVHPVRQMMALAERIAAGDYAARASVGAGDELGRLAESLNRMAAGLQTLERLRRDLVADVAHELRTPLANLQGYLEAMAEGVTPPSGETIASLHEEVLRLVRLVEALHELSLFDARLPRVNIQPVDVRALVRRLLDRRAPEFTGKGIALQQHLVDCTARADPDLLAQAVHNLIDNALKYTPAGGEVSVAVVPEGTRLRIAVTNTGEGIAPQDLPFIFERFYRGEKSRSRASGGAGIGLSIVKEVARVHGGDVGAQSAADRTSIWLTLPARPA
ncbi:MAG: ATP-binding protein [Armatimonadota bacterium]|nr:ATP-binding protein [Armatimonadota bacterium]MDR7551249.1 ATP-binding protein [Armatimonadota bacterium]